MTEPSGFDEFYAPHPQPSRWYLASDKGHGAFHTDTLAEAALIAIRDWGLEPGDEMHGGGPTGLWRLRV